MFKQAAIAVQDQPAYARLYALIEAAFKTGDVEVLLSRAARAKLRIRDYEGVLRRGLLGIEAVAFHQALPASDQAQIRERYLQLVEAVAMELRQRYFRVYAYY
jgi:hypothetical protein